MSNLSAKFGREVAKYCQYIRPGMFEYAINISHKYNYLYVETPKAGCSSIKMTLQRMELDLPDFYREDFEDIHNRNFSPLLKASQVGSFDRFINRPNLFKFCFARNPYIRLLSAYLEKIKLNKPQKKDILQHLGKNIRQLNIKISFDEFIRVIYEQPIANLNDHWNIQYYQTCQNSIKYNFIGKVENFDRDFEFVLNTVNKDYQKYVLKEQRHASGADKLLQTYYTPALIDLVRKKFALDFEHFGYSSDFEDCLLANQESQEKLLFI
ncbi:MAG: sulfotransferase family 2 domain-containing protein [Cyanobacteria bacterium P01_A01_bin.83]